MPVPSEEIEVELHAGYKGDETPRRFRLAERTVEVAGILGRWVTPAHDYFRVAGVDGHSYTLRRDSTDGGWDLTETIPLV